MSCKFFKKIVAGMILSVFTFSNAGVVVSAMENADFNDNKPALRGEGEYSMKLKGDISYITQATPVSISLRDSDVKQVLRMFADKAGLNIIFHSSVSGNVTLDLVDVPLNKAFDMVMEINQLTYVVDDNTVIVAPAGTADFNIAKQDMTLIPVKYVSAAALANFLNKSIFSMNKPGLSSSQVVTTNPVTNELIIFGSQNDVAMAKKIVDKFDQKPKTTTFKVNHTTPAEMADMVCKMLLPASGATGGAASVTGGAASAGGGSGSSMELNSGTLACTVSGKAGEGSLELQNLSVAFYPQLGTLSIIGGSEHQLEMIKEFILHTDKKQPQAYLEVSIIELSEDGSKELLNTWNIFSKVFSASFNGESTASNTLYPMFLKGNGFTNVSIQDDGTVKELFSVSKYRGPLTISYAIDYLVRNGKARVIVNPKIIITNGVESKIEVTQDYLESVEIDSSTSTGGTVVTRDYNIEDDQGVTVSITPFISPDGYVTLNITPEYSTEIGSVPGSETVDGRTVSYKAATLLSHRNLDLKNIRIKDGETLVIGGMIQEHESKTINKIPVLGDLPAIGGLFRSTISSKSKSEMVIMLTPKIITDDEDAVGNLDTL